VRSVGIVVTSPPKGFGGSLPDFARQLWWERRLRTRFFPAEAFGEPAWDLILHLFASKAEGEAVHLNNVHLGADVPPRAALARVRALEALGLIGDDPDARIRRPRRIALTPLARARLELLLLQMQAQRQLRSARLRPATTQSKEDGPLIERLLACRAELDAREAWQAAAYVNQAIEVLERAFRVGGCG